MIEIELPIKPFSVNAYRYRDQRFKTKEARAWEEQLKGLLEEYAKQFNELKTDFDANGGTFHVWITATYPPHVFNNKSNNVSAKTIDITNFEKPLIDMIFKECIGVDDRYITQLLSTKACGYDTSLRVKIVYLPKSLLLR